MKLEKRAAAVELQRVTRRYGMVTAVDQVSLAVEPGTLVTLLGPSGCGKTTILRLIAGLEIPNDGEILIDGVHVTLRPAAERDIGMVFQSYALFPHMTVLENVAYGLAASRLRRHEQAERARAALTMVGLEGYDERLPSALSGGQQQRVALARAVVVEPRVLLFDEPLSNLDAKLRRRMRDEIRELQSRLGITAVYVTHDQEEAMAVSDRVVVMREGRIAQAGTPAELYDAPADRFVADFIGSANLLACEVVGIGTDGVAQVGIGRRRLLLPARGAAPGKATLAVRPAAIRLAPAGTPSEPGPDGRVLRSSWLGDHVEYSLESELGPLFAVDHSGRPPLPSGTPVTIGFADRGLALLRD